MKKLLILALILLFACTLTACGRSKEDVITVEDGYLVVNGSKTEYKVDTADIITVEDGYLVVNGVKTEYKVEAECAHLWNTVTTAPTCTEEGYDIMTCSVCNKSIRTNVFGAKAHRYSSYTIDDDSHWQVCDACGDIVNK